MGAAIAVLPLTYILTITKVKNIVEDHELDEQFNTIAVTRLSGSWRNVNVPRDPRHWLEKMFRLDKPDTAGCVTRIGEKESRGADIDLRDMLSKAQNKASSAHSCPPSMTGVSLTASSFYPAVVLSNFQTTGTTVWEHTLWKKLLVGDIVFLSTDVQIPADILILSTSADNGCYLETKDLDGETDLKSRKAVCQLIRSEEDIEQTRFYVDADKPEPDLYSFHGTLHSTSTLGESTEPLSIDNLILRGCTLRNTSWVIGLILYTGSDTKTMQNSNLASSKQSKTEKETDLDVIVNFVILTIVCLLSAIVNSFWQTQTDVCARLFEYIFDSEPVEGVVANKFLSMVSVLIPFHNIGLISSHVAIETVKTMQAYFPSRVRTLFPSWYPLILLQDISLFSFDIPKTRNVPDDLQQIWFVLRSDGSPLQLSTR